MADYNKAWSWLLPDEGGSQFTDDPIDHGGATKYGITLNSYTAWCAKHGMLPPTVDDLKAMTEQTAQTIAKEFYWNVICGDSLKNDSIALALFNIAYLASPSKSIQLMQDAAGIKKERQDGICGPNTIELINALPAGDLLTHFVINVQNHFVDIVIKDPSQIRFLRGWLKRSQRLLFL